MFGPPEDVEGNCNARVRIADDYGDNHATLLCQLEPGHDGRHREEFKRSKESGGKIVVTWECDEGKEDRD